ncbi:DUF362 domain-containing protein [candidate division KSB1 bacterium]|nr:DUF362 domain-containing protein [candidate division KSB1 bacterium]
MKQKVFLASCEGYDPPAIAQKIKTAVNTIAPKLHITGRVVIKPNLVMAHPKVATEGYTRAEVIEGLLQVLQEYTGITQTAVVEKSGLGVSTSYMYRNAGYRALRKKYGIRLVSMEESHKRIVVANKARLQYYFTVAREMAQREFLIFVPKLKTNVLSHAYSGAIKLNIGTIDSAERLFHHNRDLPIKLADLLEIANPNLIVTDGIRMAFGGNQMTQHGTDLGVLVISTNVVAHDMVCAHLLNLDPLKIEHIREAAYRGFGPSSLNEIEIIGDYPVHRAQSKTRDLDFGFCPVHQFKSNFAIQTGKPYCIAGCQGIFLDWLYMINDRKPKLLKKFPKLTVLIGKCGAVHADRILLVGNCACASRPLKAKRITRIHGCPPSHKRIVWDMMIGYGIFNPLVRPSLIWDAYIRYPFKKLKGWFLNLKKDNTSE